jgi:hypothetical protein
MRTTRLLVLLPLLCLALATPVRSASPPAPPRADAVFYDSSEGLAALATANFSADFAALIALKGLGALGVDTTVTVYPRQPASVFGPNERSLPGLGCYTRMARTQAKSQQQRVATLEAHYEYLCRSVGRDADPTLIRKQAELASEAILMLIDRFPGAGGGIEGGGLEPQSVIVDIDGSGPAEGLEFYEQWVHVVSPIWDTDVVT